MKSAESTHTSLNVLALIKKFNNFNLKLVFVFRINDKKRRTWTIREKWKARWKVSYLLFFESLDNCKCLQQGKVVVLVVRINAYSGGVIVDTLR